MLSRPHCIQKEKTYTVEKLLASRLADGKKEYLVRWEGYTEKHDSWEPIENLSNLVNEMAAFDLAKENANQEHVSLHSCIVGPYWRAWGCAP